MGAFAQLRHKADWVARPIAILFVVAAGSLGLVAGFSDLGLGENVGLRVVITFGVYVVATVFFGAFMPNRWYLAVIAAWGPALLGAVGLFAKLRAGGNYPKSSFLVLTLCAAPLVSLAGGFAGRVMGRRNRSSDGPIGQIDDRIELPVSDERVFEIARWALSQNPLKPVARQFDPGVAMRIGSCHAKRRAGDDAIIGFAVTVLVDPQLGVPVRDPTAEPRWHSRTALVLHLDKNGGTHDGTLT